MKNFITKTNPFEALAAEYDKWYDKYPYVFKSEVEAIREKMPDGNSTGIKIGLSTGKFSMALGIKEGVEPAIAMRRIAVNRGLEVMDGIAEKLPYKDLHFDFVVIASSLNYFYDIHSAFVEANRVLKRHGSLIIGFIEKNSKIGISNAKKNQKNSLYSQATFYSVEKITTELQRAGFRDLEYSQTLFGDLDEIKQFQPAKSGYAEGSFIVIKATKK